MEGHVECLLEVTGDTAALNTFDKLFHSGTGPQWADCPPDNAPRYSFHALFPVPEDVQQRGCQAAGRLWCQESWGVPGDLSNMQVKRLLGVRRYRFYTPVSAPKNVFLKASCDFPTLCLRLTLLDVDWGDFQSHEYHGGYRQGTYFPHGDDSFAALREEMGFAV